MINTINYSAFFDFKLFSFSSVTAHSECSKNGKQVNVSDCNIWAQQRMCDNPVDLSPFLNMALGKQKSLPSRMLAFMSNSIVSLSCIFLVKHFSFTHVDVNSNMECDFFFDFHLTFLYLFISNKLCCSFLKFTVTFTTPEIKISGQKTVSTNLTRAGAPSAGHL